MKFRGKRKKLTITDYLFLIIAVFIFTFFPAPLYAQESEPVEVEVGPIFDEADKPKVQNCFNSFKGRFPLDIFQAPLELAAGDGICPTLEIFGHEHEFCQPLEVWAIIKPVVFCLTMYQAVTLL